MQSGSSMMANNSSSNSERNLIQFDMKASEGLAGICQEISFGDLYFPRKQN